MSTKTQSPTYRYSLDDIGIETEINDSSPWRVYHLTAWGNTREELRASAGISEVDQDGGEVANYSLEEAPNAVIERVESMILKHVTNKES